MKKDSAFSALEIIGYFFVIVVIFLILITPLRHYRQKNSTASILKKTYAELFQAMQMTIGENGDVSRWGFNGGAEDCLLIEQKIVPYLKLSENCLQKAGKCVYSKSYKTLGNKYTSENLSILPAFTLSNGASVIFDFVDKCEKSNSVCAKIYIDVNGAKKPNMFGRDLFVFLLTNSNSIISPYNQNLPEEELLGDLKEGCSKKSSIAKNCAALIYNNNWNIIDKYDW